MFEACCNAQAQKENKKTLSFLNPVPIIFHLITLSEISSGRGNETT